MNEIRNCTCGRQSNMGNFCMACGAARPAASSDVIGVMDIAQASATSTHDSSPLITG